MKGKVIAINVKKGFIAVDTGNGLSILELIGGYEVQLEDIISGDLESHGGETIYNETQEESLDVFIQAIHCSVAKAKSLMN